MKRIINIVQMDPSVADAAGRQQPNKAASMDLDIYEADQTDLGGERFWEAYLKTQHVYGGIVEGQPLAILFRSLDEAIFKKLHDDLLRFCDDAVKLDDAEKNDIFGMMIFLLCIEKGDAQYDPIEQQGYEPSLAYFSALVKEEQRLRSGR